jgi:hypothetical protein
MASSPDAALGRQLGVFDVYNVDSVDPTSLVGARLKRYHHLRRFKHIMQQADSAHTASRTEAERRAQEELLQAQRELQQQQLLEGARLAREALGQTSSSVTVAYRHGGGALVRPPCSLCAPY